MLTTKRSIRELAYEVMLKRAQIADAFCTLQVQYSSLPHEIGLARIAEIRAMVKADKPLFDEYREAIGHNHEKNYHALNRFLFWAPSRKHLLCTDVHGH